MRTPTTADAVVDGLGVISVRATYAKGEEIFGEVCGTSTR
jgi:hypothetical protein